MSKRRYRYILILDQFVPQKIVRLANKSIIIHYGVFITILVQCLRPLKPKKQKLEAITHVIFIEISFVLYFLLYVRNAITIAIITINVLVVLEYPYMSDFNEYLITRMSQYVKYSSLKNWIQKRYCTYNDEYRWLMIFSIYHFICDIKWPWTHKETNNYTHIICYKYQTR